MKLNLLHPTDKQQAHKTSKRTCSAAAAAAFDIARYTDELYLSAPRKPSSFPHQNRTQTNEKSKIKINQIATYEGREKFKNNYSPDELGKQT